VSASRGIGCSVGELPGLDETLAGGGGEVLAGVADVGAGLLVEGASGGRAAAERWEVPVAALGEVITVGVPAVLGAANAACTAVLSSCVAISAAAASTCCSGAGEVGVGVGAAVLGIELAAGVAVGAGDVVGAGRGAGVLSAVGRVVGAVGAAADVGADGAGRTAGITGWQSSTRSACGPSKQRLGIAIEGGLQARVLPLRPVVQVAATFYSTAHFLVTAGVLAASRLLPASYGYVDALQLVGAGAWSYDRGVLEHISDPFAAVPSLHMAWATCVVVGLWPTGGPAASPGGRTPGVGRLPGTHLGARGGHRKLLPARRGRWCGRGGRRGRAAVRGGSGQEGRTVDP
jgi:hypothetical protein